LKIRSNGKLLLSGEYLVLKGAKALALPTQAGQELVISPSEDKQLSWSTYLNEEVLFRAKFNLDGEVLSAQDDKMALRLSQIFKSALKLKGRKAFEPSVFESRLEFPLEWGLGSSSTLIYNIAAYASVDPFELLELTFGGSGYDIACAGASGPILYSLENGKSNWEEVPFKPSFSDSIQFVYLNKKMNSREAIDQFSQLDQQSIKSPIEAISKITDGLMKASNERTFGELMMEHEKVISQLLKMKTVKEEIFPDYKKAIKSLGAWGGDFVMVLGDGSEMDYFRRKGYHTIIPFSQMVLKLTNKPA
jgi:mevalonate kinase